VITLVTQFDDPATMPSGATPSGGSSSSSCCCCCVVTAVGASILSGMHVRSIRLSRTVAPPEGLPLGRRYLRPWPEILGFLALSVAVGVIALGVWIAEDLADAVLLGIFVWVLLLYVAYRGASDEHSIRHSVVTLVAVPLVGLVEFFVWLGALS
jgi:hypothetical protein